MIGLLRQIAIQTHGVNQQVVGAGFEAHGGFPHGDSGSLVDINLIDAGGIDGGDSPRDGMLANAFGQQLAPFRQQQLGVAQPSNAIAGIENDGGRDDRSEQRTAADFVHARDQARP